MVRGAADKIAASIAARAKIYAAHKRVMEHVSLDSEEGVRTKQTKKEQ